MVSIYTVAFGMMPVWNMATQSCAALFASVIMLHLAACKSLVSIERRPWRKGEAAVVFVSLQRKEKLDRFAP